jgi:hypothetical protein
MRIHSILKYSISLLALLLASLTSFAQDDEEEDSTAQKKVIVTQNQFSIAVDFFQPILNSFSSSKKGYEMVLDYALPKDVYVVLEGGFGNAMVDYSAPDLKYSSSNSFVRAGINKSMLQRLTTDDWDMVFIGLRYGIGFIQRSDAQYSIENQYFGNSYGIIPGKTLTAHWLEITGGMRVELVKGLFAGYNIRTKFIMNGKALKELAPYYIAGFGKGEKTAVFDFNMYIGYSIRWNKKGFAPVSKEVVAPVTPTTPQ